MAGNDSKLMGELGRLLVKGPEEAEGAWRAEYLLRDDFIGFSGHFPDYPLMPAMMQVFAALHLVGLIQGARPVITSLPTAKFTEQARPGDRLLLTLKRLPPKNGEDVWEAGIVKIGAAGELPPDDKAPVATFKFATRAERDA